MSRRKSRPFYCAIPYTDGNWPIIGHEAYANMKILEEEMMRQTKEDIMIEEEGMQLLEDEFRNASNEEITDFMEFADAPEGTDRSECSRNKKMEKTIEKPKRIGRIFPASYVSECSFCNTHISSGSDICEALFPATGRKGYVHSVCAQDFQLADKEKAERTLEKPKRIGRIFPASYVSECSFCHTYISSGSDICEALFPATGRKEYVHSVCAK